MPKNKVKQLFISTFLNLFVNTFSRKVTAWEMHVVWQFLCLLNTLFVVCLGYADHLKTKIPGKPKINMKFTHDVYFWNCMFWGHNVKCIDLETTLSSDTKWLMTKERHAADGSNFMIINKYRVERSLPWQPILEAKSAKLVDLPSLVALAFRNRLEYQNTDGRINSAVNFPTSNTHLVRFGAVTPEFTLLICVQPASI